MSLIASTSNDIKLHHWPDGVHQQTYIPAKYEEGHHVRSISWAKDGSWIVLVPFSSSAEIISAKENVKLLQTIDGVAQPSCATFQNGTKKNIALGTLTGQVLVYDVKARGVKKHLARTHGAINLLQYNAKDSHLAAACDSGEILLYSCMSSNLSTSYRIPRSSGVSAINFHRSKRNLLSAGSEEGVVAAWDTNTSTMLLEVQAHQAQTTAIAFSPVRSDLLVTGGMDRRFAFYDVLSKKSVLEVEVMSSITALDFSPCGTFLGLGSHAGGIVLYDTRKLNTPVTAFPAHKGKIRHLLFQKVLAGKEQQTNNSVYEMGDGSLPRHQEDEKGVEEDLFLDSMYMEGHNFTNSPINQKGLEEKSSVVGDEEEKDSFLLLLQGTFESPDTETTESTPLSVPQETVPRVYTTKTTANETASTFSVQTQTAFGSKHFSSTPKIARQELAVDAPSPICNNEKACSDASSEEWRKVMREEFGKCRQELRDEMKGEMKWQIDNALDEFNRHVLNLQMTMVKQHVNLEINLEKMMGARECVCDEVLVRRNAELTRELNYLKKQLTNSSGNK